MKGTVEAVSTKRLPKGVDLKIGGEWFGIWLQDQSGKPTNLAWMAATKKGDALDFDYEVNGDFKNIMSAKSPIMAGPEPEQAKGPTQRTDRDGRDASIERQVCLKAAAEMTAALITANKLATPAQAIDALKQLYQAGVGCLS